MESFSAVVIVLQCGRKLQSWNGFSCACYSYVTVDKVVYLLSHTLVLFAIGYTPEAFSLSSRLILSILNLSTFIFSIIYSWIILFWFCFVFFNNYLNFSFVFVFLFWQLVSFHFHFHFDIYFDLEFDLFLFMVNICSPFRKMNVVHDCACLASMFVIWMLILMPMLLAVVITTICCICVGVRVCVSMSLIAKIVYNLLIYILLQKWRQRVVPLTLFLHTLFISLSTHSLSVCDSCISQLWGSLAWMYMSRLHVSVNPMRSSSMIISS